MRINKFVASSTHLSRRKAEEAIAAGQVTVNGQPASPGQEVSQTDVVALQGRRLIAPVTNTTIVLNKPVGYVVSRSGQGAPTIYDLLPEQYHRLNPVGRLDKDSSGLLLLTDDGDIANRLTHPSYQKEKLYEVSLDKPLTVEDFKIITETGVDIGDGRLSRLQLSELGTRNPKLGHTSYSRIPNSEFRITMREGRNRQIRRTFDVLGYTVQTIHRTHFGPYQLSGLALGEVRKV